MTDVLRTLIVPASLVVQARNLGAALAPPGAGMYSTGLSADGFAPASHYISSGMIGQSFAEILADPEALYAAAVAGAQAQGITLTETLADCQALVAQSDVSEEPPFDAMARLGLQLVQPAT